MTHRTLAVDVDNVGEGGARGRAAGRPVGFPAVWHPDESAVRGTDPLLHQ